MQKKGESIVGCADRIAKKVLGGKLDLVDSFGYWGLGSWTVSTTIGNTALTKAANRGVTNYIKNAQNAGARTKGNIIKKSAASKKAAITAARMGSMKSGLTGLSKVTGVLGLAATGTSATMRGLGYYFGECSKECPCSNK